MQEQMLMPQPVPDRTKIGGWLAFIGFRIIAGLVMNLVGLAAMAVNKAQGMYYFYGSDILLVVITCLGAATLVFYFLKKKPFVFLYIASVAVTLVNNALVQGGALFAVQIVVESLLVAYLLMSRRVAYVYDFHIRSNAVPRYEGAAVPVAAAGLNPQQEQVFADLLEAKKQHDEGTLTDEAFEERKRKLLLAL